MATILDAFSVWLKAQGSHYINGDKVPLALGTLRDYPLVRAVLRGRKITDVVGAGKSIISKIKWQIAPGYGPLPVGAAVSWQRRGDLDFLESQWCREFGSIEFDDMEIRTQASGVWDPTALAQTFDSVMSNYMQDFYIDRTNYIEQSMGAVPTADMETGNGNVPRSLLAVLNEMEAGHNAAGKAGMYPDVANGPGTIEGKNPALYGQKGRAQVFKYTAVGKTAGTLTSTHIFKALARALAKTNFTAVPDAEAFSEGSIAGPREILSDLEGCLLMNDILAAHDNFISEESDTGVYTTTSRFAGVALMDIPTWEDKAMYPRYSGTTPATTTNATLVTWNDSANGLSGPRFFGPNWKHIHMKFLEGKMLAESEVYELKETRPGVMVKYTESVRNLHFDAFDRHFVVAPGADMV